MRQIQWSLCILLSVISFVSARKVKIELDYTNLPCWSYVMDYNSDCIMTDEGNESSIKTNVVCAMTARPSIRHHSARLEFTMDSVAVTSKLFNETQRQNIIRKLTGASFGLALVGGCPMVDTLSSFSVSELSEWDLVIQFAKLLPFIPERPVRKGYSWEESAVFILPTTMGKVPCEVYRRYMIDSLDSKRERVFISWNFTYNAVKAALPDSSVLRQVPISGKGKGSAIVDLPMKMLLQANVEFRTPVAEYGDIKVVWVENTVLRARPEVICMPKKP